MGKKAILACGLALALLAGCAQRGTEGESSLPEGDSSAAVSSTQEKEEVSAPENSYPIQLGEFSIWFPEEGFSYALTEPVTAEDGVLYSGGDSKRMVAEMVSADPISDPDSPFSASDALYSQAVDVKEYTFGEYAGKGYWIQEEDTDSVVGGYRNTIFYCIAVDDELVTIAFYAAFGLGIGTQKEEFETVLSSIQKV